METETDRPVLVTLRCPCGQEQTLPWWPEWGDWSDREYRCWPCQCEEGQAKGGTSGQ